MHTMLTNETYVKIGIIARLQFRTIFFLNIDIFNNCFGVVGVL